MNKNILKNFSIYSRNRLIDIVQNQLFSLEIHENEQKPIIMSIKNDGQFIESKTNAFNEIDNTNIEQYNSLIEEFNSRLCTNKDFDDVYNSFVEEVAYTWFSRLVTIRFMEVNNYLPDGVRILSTANSDGLEPDIISQYNETSLKITCREESMLNKLAIQNSSKSQNDMFNFLFISQCNQLNRILPEMFEKVEPYEELLFPFIYNDKDGVIYKLVNDIPEDYFDIQVKNSIGQVEILGWMHQYYNTERKDEVIDAIKKNRVKKEDIPFATQLFTTDWVVKYMVDNSLGRYWLERNPDSSIKASLEFLIPTEIEVVDEKISPEDLKVLDNAMGSGHILIYTFDVLLNIYLSKGYSKEYASRLIIEKNLYGLDIDKSSYQLAYFSLMMKARQNNPNAFNFNISNNIEVFTESSSINIQHLEYLGLSMEKNKRETALKQILSLIDTFNNSKEIGSLLIVGEVDEKLLLEFINDYNINENINIYETQTCLKKILKLNKILSQKYDIMVTNPPYLNKFSPELKKYLNSNYKDYQKDLFSVFIYRNIKLCKPNGYAAYMTPFVWMFINSYAKLRKYIIDNKHITSLIQMEYSAFEDASVPICTFILKNSQSNFKGQYIKLSDFLGGMEVQKLKTLEAINNPTLEYLYNTDQANFKKIPGYPIAYWSSVKILEAFEKGKPLDSILDARQGMATGNNKEFLRLWWEVNYKDINFNVENFENYQKSFLGKYVPYNKGGQKRNWYGNYDYVIKFDDKNYSQLLKSGNHLPSRAFYFREAITWGLITSGDFSIRYREPGSVHDVAGMSAFSEDSKTLKYILGLLSTPIANKIFKKLNPTLNLQVGDFKNFPVIAGNNYEDVIKLVNENIKKSKEDWDLWETSWGFKSHFLIDKNNEFILIEEAYEYSKSKINNRFNQLKTNQEKLNVIFIELYNLEDEISSKVVDKDITLTKIFDDKQDIYAEIKGNRYIKTKKDLIKSFISYAVGCMFGRYSLDVEGIAYAGGTWDNEIYKTYNPVLDNNVYLSEDDIVKRFIQFVSVVYGKENLDDNLAFIAIGLGDKGNSKEVIKNYLINDFYKDHARLYKKRPLYCFSNVMDNRKLKALKYIHRFE